MPEVSIPQSLTLSVNAALSVMGRGLRKTVASDAYVTPAGPNITQGETRCRLNR
jgi:hypothetical protein